MNAMDLISGQGGPPPGPPPDMGAAPGAAGLDLMSALGGGAPLPGPPDQGPPADQGPPQPASEGDALDAIMAAVDAYVSMPGVDESEKLTMEKITSLVQGIKAANQKSTDSVTGASPQLRKALASGAGGGIG
jgi:hypothetical protein